MGQPVTQHSFLGGETSDDLASDNPRYAISLRTCKNFLPIRHGALVNTPGTKLVARAKNNGKPKLVSFVFSDLQSMILEFGDQYLRFHTNGGPVLTGGGAVYELATPYVIADVFRLKFSQAGDVIAITHQSYEPKELTRVSNANWTLTTAALGPPVGFWIGNIFPAPNGYGGDSATGWNNAHAYHAGDYAFDAAAANPAAYIAIAPNTNKQPSASPLYWALVVDASHTPKVWPYTVTIKYGDALGRKFESLPVSPLFGTPVCRSADRPVSFGWSVPVGSPGFNYVILGFGIYAGRNGLLGWVGDADKGVVVFQDDASVGPDFSIQPPRGTNPFLYADGLNAASSYSYPAAVVHHELRRIFGGSAKKPNHFIGSKQDDYTNWDVNFPVQDTDTYDFGIASNKLQDIRSFLSTTMLLIFTGAGVFGAQGQQGSSVKPTSVQLREDISEHGASFLQPLRVSNAGLYVTAKGNRVRDVCYNWQVQGLDGNDLSDLAIDFFDGHTIVDWCYADAPNKLVWSVRDDGLLLSMTYDRTRQVWGWAQHPRAATFHSVASVPEGTEDATYLVAERATGTFIERMASRYIPDVRLACFLDCAVSFDGRNVGLTAMTVSGGSFDADDIVTVDASAAAFAASDVGDQVVIDPDGGEPTRITVTQYNSTTEVVGRLEQPLPVAFQGGATARWGWARDTLTGLDHLEGQSVTVLADADVQGPFTVSGGQIGPLSPPALLATAGLPYDSDAELQDLAADSVRTNVKSVGSVTFKVVGSRGIYAGESFEPEGGEIFDASKDLIEAKLRTVDDDFDPTELVTGDVTVVINSSWNSTGGRACVRQSDPLPLTIVSVTRDVEVGGKGS